MNQTVRNDRSFVLNVNIVIGPSKNRSAGHCREGEGRLSCFG
jgi:hypothetical protein